MHPFDYMRCNLFLVHKSNLKDDVYTYGYNNFQHLVITVRVSSSWMNQICLFILEIIIAYTSFYIVPSYQYLTVCIENGAESWLIGWGQGERYWQKL